VFTLQQVCNIEAKTSARMHIRFMRKLRKWPVSTVHLQKFLKNIPYIWQYTFSHWPLVWYCTTGSELDQNIMSLYRSDSLDWSNVDGILPVPGSRVTYQNEW